MAVKPIITNWNKKVAFKSGLLFFLHSFLFLLITAALLWYDKFDNFGAHMQTHGANYVYALVCIVLLFIITYVYFLFENKMFLANGKNIALIFTILDLYVIMSYLLGEKIGVYATVNHVAAV